jgi:acetyl esterase/lipase
VQLSKRARAAEFCIDPDRIALVGHSAGGHLAALAAVADEAAGWDVGDNLGESSRVRAAVVFAGPSDLAREFPLDWVSELVLGVFGVAQARLLHEAVLAAGGRSTLVIVEHTGHDFEPVEGQPSLSRAALLDMLREFLDRYLR